ncbi:MAG: hypothetical protein QG599_3734 [Pseudomonadota bacterium]|nr:hypothetical protein [Pseudomonadota bacterium]
MADENPDQADSMRVESAPSAMNPLMIGLIVVCFLLIFLSMGSNAYLWHLWRQDQAVSPLLPQPDPQLQALQVQVQSLSSDLDQVKKTVELYKAVNDALKEEMKQLQDSQQTYRNEVQQQLQNYRDQSIQQQRQQPKQPQPLQNQPRNPVTW